MAKDWDLQLYYHSATRDMFVEKHRFYAEQVRERLLSQFNDLEGDADRYLAKKMDELSSLPSAGYEDDSHIPEMAYDASISHYSQLADLKKQVLLGSLAGMYHQWDKDLREHLDRELSHYTDKAWIAKHVWRPEAIKMLDILTEFGWEVKNQPFFDLIQACHIVVNVYKHGKGTSLQLLHTQYPKYLPDPLALNGYSWGGEDFIDYQWLHVTNEDFEEFAQAMDDFWITMPERLFFKFPDEQPQT